MKNLKKEQLNIEEIEELSKSIKSNEIQNIFNNLDLILHNKIKNILEKTEEGELQCYTEIDDGYFGLSSLEIPFYTKVKLVCNNIIVIDDLNNQVDWLQVSTYAKINILRTISLYE